MGRASGASPGKRVLALVTDAYGGHGGIAQYNQDVLAALAADPAVGEIIVLPRKISRAIDPTQIPSKVSFRSAASAGLLAFAWAFLAQLVGGRRDLIYCAHVNLVPFCWLAARLTRSPWVLCVYGVEAWTRSDRAWTNRLVGRADHYISISKVTLDRFRNAWPMIAESRCSIVPNAIHLENYGMKERDPALVARYGLEGRRVLMTLGRLHPTEQAKGLDRVIERLPHLSEIIPEIAYLICGEGGDRPRLEALAAASGVSDRVKFAGMVSEDEKAAHYRLADLYIMPSRFEGFGFVFLEALACGVPVVGSSIDGSRDALIEGELGRLVDPASPEEIDRAIIDGLAAPRGIPDKLSFFSFDNFRARLRAALRPYLG